MEQEEIDNILGNIENIPAENLADYIVDESISLKLMMETGDLTVEKRQEIESIIESKKKEREEQEKQEWEKARDSNSIEVLKQFVNSNPNSNYLKEAEDLIAKIKAEDDEKDKVLKEIKNDIPHYSHNKINRLIDKQSISKEDLYNIGVPGEVVDNLDKDKKLLDILEPPEKIPDGYTEVYFWGLSGSGKTCAISSISKVAKKEALIRIDSHTDNTGSAYNYFTQIKNIFNDNYFGVLPAGTNIDKSQYLPIQLVNNQKKHPLAIIDLSGEIFSAFHKSLSGENVENDKELGPTYKRVRSYLKGPNKKIHFFVVDLSVKPDKIIDQNDQATQGDYLSSMSSYLNENKILKNSTEGVFIVASKSDQLSKDREQAKRMAIEHLKDGYKDFYTSLKESAKSSGLSDELQVIAFTMGDVYFQDFCYLDPEPPRDIMQIIKENTGGVGPMNSFTRMVQGLKMFFSK